jgi:hypothetical protein
MLVDEVGMEGPLLMIYNTYELQIVAGVSSSIVRMNTPLGSLALPAIAKTFNITPCVSVM